MSTYDLPAPIKPQPWQVDALCAQVDPELWFPDGSAPHGSQSTQDAIAMCHRCPVQQRCLAYAMAAEAGKYWKNRYGICGGLLPIERYSLARAAHVDGDGAAHVAQEEVMPHV